MKNLNARTLIVAVPANLIAACSTRPDPTRVLPFANLKGVE